MIDYGYISENGMIENNSSTDGWFGSHYIGPTKKETLQSLPTPTHAAKYMRLYFTIEQFITGFM